jgi:Rrf2 family nitric oxide-sensitive transcriptional repressor
MRLTHHTDLGLRALIYLGVADGGLVTIGEIARRHRIGENHLMKVVSRLARLGYVRTVRGQHGGLVLGRPAAAIRIGDVVRDLEEQFSLVECFDPPRNACAITPGCRLRPVLAEALDAFLAVLDRYTLADLVAAPQEIRPLLGLEAAHPLA